MPVQKPSPNQDLLRIARKEGVSLEALKSHQENQDLLAVRDTGFLFSEDEVFVPVTEPKKVSVKVGETLTLVYRPAKRRLRLHLRDDAGVDLQCDYTLQDFEYDGTERETLPDKLYGFAYKGELDELLPAAVTRLKLVMNDDEDNAITLELGRLDSVSSTRGLKLRLLNLGLYQGEVEPDAMDNASTLDPELAEAIRLFQRQQGLPVSGAADPQTRDKLRLVCGG